MPHVPRRTLLLAGLSLLLLAPPPSSAQAPARTKSPGPRSLSFAVDPGQVSPEQRLKLALAEIQPLSPATAPASRPKGLHARRAEPTAVPATLSPAERAELATRAKAKLELYRQGPRPRTAVTPTGTRRLPAWRPPAATTTVRGPQGLTPAERAKAEAAGIRVAPEEVRR